MIDLHEGVAEIFREAQEITIRHIERAHFRVRIRRAEDDRAYKKFNARLIRRRERLRIKRKKSPERAARVAFERAHPNCEWCNQPITCRKRSGNVRRFCKPLCATRHTQHQYVMRIEAKGLHPSTHTT